MMHDWLEPLWRRLVALDTRLPHALLFIGPAGAGKRALVDALAARLLCQTPAADGHACGQCASCTLRRSRNHPDFYTVMPAAQAAASGNGGGGDSVDGGGANLADEATESGDGKGKGKAKSSQIIIEQVRALQSALAVTGHQSSRRVIIVEPAEAMNTFTANALLKLLEEPPEGCVFLLVSSMPRRLLPTIRSRCQTWTLGRPQAAAVEQWAASQPEAVRALLPISGGMPLAAERLAESGLAAMHARFVRDVAGLPGGDPLILAEQWEKWLKSKDAAAAGFDMVRLVDWMLRWASDLASLRLGGRVRFFPAQAAVLTGLSARLSVAGAVNCYNELSRMRRVAQHPLNARSMLEDMLLRYVRVVSGSRP